MSAFFVFCIFIRLKCFDLIEEFTVMFTNITFITRGRVQSGDGLRKYINISIIFLIVYASYIYKLDMLMYGTVDELSLF